MFSRLNIVMSYKYMATYSTSVALHPENINKEILAVTDSSHIEQSTKKYCLSLILHIFFCLRNCSDKNFSHICEMGTDLFCQPISKNCCIVILEICVHFLYDLHLEDINNEILTVSDTVHIFCWKDAQTKTLVTIGEDVFSSDSFHNAMANDNG